MKNRTAPRSLSFSSLIRPCRAVLSLLLLAGLGSSLEGKNPYRKEFFNYYGTLVTGTQLDSLPSASNHCGVCHYDFSGGGARNLYGQAFEAEPHGSSTEMQAAFYLLETGDQDLDGYSSGVEIKDNGFSYVNTPTFPGLAIEDLGMVVNVPTGEISPYLTPSTGADTTPPTVTVVGPNGGEVVTGNVATTIEWTANDEESGIVDVEIYEYLDGNYKKIAEGLDNTGSYTWFPGNRPRTDARIRIEVVNGASLEAQDESDTAFEVIPPTDGLTTLRDFDMPGSQPFEAGSITATPENCAVCHGDYDVTAEPYHNWRGSMMALASLDPLFEANLAIANQDAPDSGDLCLRCHISRGWIQGRSVPTDGSAMLVSDKIGVSCDLCHRMLNPNYEAGISPLRDTEVLSQLSFPFPDDPAVYGTGMYVVDELATHKRGPFDLNTAPSGHDFFYSPFHRTGEFCGTCHDVSNPAFIKDPVTGLFVPQELDAPNTTFSPHSIVPVERTYSEWKNSAYNILPTGVYAPEFAGNKEGGFVSTCQDCHMSDVLGYGANPLTTSAPERPNMPLHDMTGGSTWLPELIANGSVPGVNPLDYPHLDLTAVQDGIARSVYMLENAAALSAEQTVGDLVVRVTNNTGHKLPTGYPEGRRIWVNVKFYDAGDNVVKESGAYDSSTGILTKDAEAKIYEVHPGIGENVAGIFELDPGYSLHFVLNNEIFEDNRIPPMGFTNAAFAEFGGAPVGHAYADGQHWDDSAYDVPAGAVRAEVNLYYQSTSKEFVEFLKNENKGGPGNIGEQMYDLWNNNGKCPPTLMATAEYSVLEAAADADEDGLTNIEEEAYGSDPNSAASAHRPIGHIAEGHMAMTYVRSTSSTAQITVQVSSDLAAWHDAVMGTEVIEHSVVDNGDGTETVEIRMGATIDPGTKQFLRLKVE
ncbi:MAG: Ig-like domain-containing protein [Oceanipulchritudo sp.]